MADLARESSTDPKTVSTFLGGSRWPTRTTLAKIEDALGMTPGTLAGAGEDQRAAGVQPDARSLRNVSDEELASELSYRLTQRRRELEDTLDQLRFMRRRYRDAVHDMMGGIEGYDQEAGTQDGIPLADLDRAQEQRARDRAAIPDAEKNDDPAMTGGATESLQERRRRRMLERGQPVDRAADDRGE